jgi:hypothetical protein
VRLVWEESGLWGYRPWLVIRFLGRSGGAREIHHSSKDFAIDDDVTTLLHEIARFCLIAIPFSLIKRGFCPKYRK